MGTIAFFLLFFLHFYIAVVTTAFYKAARTAVLWTSVYVFFLFFLRLLLLLHVGTAEQIMIAGSWTTFIPLILIITQLFLNKKMHVPPEYPPLLDK